MKPYKIKVEAYGTLSNEKEVVIQQADTGVFQAFCSGVLVASSMSSRRLSEWAFSGGSRTVRHDYDLRQER